MGMKSTSKPPSRALSTQLHPRISPFAFLSMIAPVLIHSSLSPVHTCMCSEPWPRVMIFSFFFLLSSFLFFHFSFFSLLSLLFFYSFFIFLPLFFLSTLQEASKDGCQNCFIPHGEYYQYKWCMKTMCICCIPILHDKDSSPVIAMDIYWSFVFAFAYMQP